MLDVSQCHWEMADHGPILTWWNSSVKLKDSIAAQIRYTATIQYVGRFGDFLTTPGHGPILALRDRYVKAYSFAVCYLFLRKLSVGQKKNCYFPPSELGKGS